MKPTELNNKRLASLSGLNPYKKDKFNLSERILNSKTELIPYPLFHPAILEADVKEFIRLLKVNLHCNISPVTGVYGWRIIDETIDELAGSKLIRVAK